MSYDCRFLGAAEDIGRLGFNVETQGGSRFLFDYGIAPDKPPAYPLETPPMDQVFLTHAHLDHSGMIPWLVSRFDSTIMTTRPTAQVSTLMHRDSLKIARTEGFPEPFSDDDIEDTEQLYDIINHGDAFDLADVRASFHSAGHIPGATQVRIDDGSTSMVFTGDLYTRPQRLVDAGKPVPCDVLCIETTYAGREHPDREQTEKDFIAFCHEVSERGGTVVAAAFAVGRAQELAMVLAGQGLNVWMDGMARAVTDIFADNTEYLMDAKKFRKAMDEVKQVYNHRGRFVALREADVIITTSGMLEGGPALFYIDKLRNDKRNAIALTGYQVRGTGGRMLMDEGKLDFDNRNPGKKVLPVPLEVQHFDFSAHAGHADLVDFIKATGADDVVLFHGDNRQDLAVAIEDFATPHMPMQGDSFTVG